MNPGRLRHRIDVLDNVKTVNQLNETEYRFEKIKSMNAEIIPQTGSLQKQVAETILTNVTHKIIVRYNAGKDITKNMKIKFRNHEFDIKYIQNPYYSDKYLEIFVEENLI